MRILHVDSERSWRGGQNQVLLLMRRQRAQGDDPLLVAPAGAALSIRAGVEGFRVWPVPMRGTWDLASVAGLARVMREVRPDVVHWHAARAHAVGAMASLLAPAPARVLSRRVQFPVRRSLGSMLLYALPVDRIAAISAAVRDALVASGVAAGKIDVVPSGIDPAPDADPAARSALRHTFGLHDQAVLAITVAALAKGKGHSDLLRATAAASVRAPMLMLWIVGAGPLEQDLRRECRSLGLEGRVQFLGFRTDIQSLLHAADFFCLATQSEGLGSSILEAMSVGLPVVATRVGGIPEVVQEGETGILVPDSDPVALAAAMERMAADAGSREAMGAASRRRATLFSADRTAEGTYRVYGAALSARGRAGTASGPVDPVNSTC
jgi:glycosyltransferase involved in cell wall biosynthesis